MKAVTPRLAFVPAAAMAGALMFAFVPALQAASPADGQPAAPGAMDHGAAATMEHAKVPDEQMRAMMQHHEQMMARMHGQQMRGGVPVLPGQDAFGAIQEIVRVLESDPKTDWSKVDLEALRQHLGDRWPQWLECEDRPARRRRAAHGDLEQSEGGATHPRPRLHWHPRERVASPAAPSGDGEG